MSMGREYLDEMMCNLALQDDETEDYISRKEWVLGNGKTIKIAKMEDDHILNTMRWIQRNGHPYAKEYLSLFRNELLKRFGGEAI